MVCPCVEYIENNEMKGRCNFIKHGVGFKEKILVKDTIIYYIKIGSRAKSLKII